jgi:hypothetical protein
MLTALEKRSDVANQSEESECDETADTWREWLLMNLVT